MTTVTTAHLLRRGRLLEVATLLWNVVGVVWTALTGVAMFALAAGKRRVGTRLGNPVLITESRVTVVDGMLACAVLLGLALDTLLGWWWADPLAGLVIVFSALREAREIFRG